MIISIYLSRYICFFSDLTRRFLWSVPLHLLVQGEAARPLCAREEEQLV